MLSVYGRDLDGNLVELGKHDADSILPLKIQSAVPERDRRIASDVLSVDGASSALYPMVTRFSQRPRRTKVARSTFVISRLGAILKIGGAKLALEPRRPSAQTRRYRPRRSDIPVMLLTLKLTGALSVAE